MSSERYEKSIVLEVFTNAEDEDSALLTARTVDHTMYENLPESGSKKIVKKVLGEKGVEAVKKLISR